MKTTSFIYSLITCLALTSQLACSAKIEGSSSDPGSPLIQDAPGFDLKTADGSWATGCLQEKWGGGSENSLKMENGKFEATTKIYLSAQCRPDSLQDTFSNQGQVVVQRESLKEPGSYEVEIQNVQGNVTQIKYDLIRIENNQLFMGDSAAPFDGMYPSQTDRQKVYKKQ